MNIDYNIVLSNGMSGTFNILQDTHGYWHVDDFHIEGNGYAITTRINDVLRDYFLYGIYPDPENEGPLNQAVPAYLPESNLLMGLHDFGGGSLYWREEQATFDLTINDGPSQFGTYEVTPAAVVPLPGAFAMFLVGFVVLRWSKVRTRASLGRCDRSRR